MLIKNKSHTIISVDAEKSPDKIQPSFMNKDMRQISKLGMGGMFIYLTKSRAMKNSQLTCLIIEG